MKIAHINDKRLYPNDNVSFVMALLTLAQIQASMPDKLVAIQSDHWVEVGHTSKVILARDLPSDPTKAYKVRYLSSKVLEECPVGDLTLSPSLFLSRWKIVEVS